MTLYFFNPETPPEKATEGIVDGFEGWARTALTATALMGNIRTVLMQGTSFTIGMNEIGSYYTEALGAFAAGPLDFLAEVRSKSAMMKNRAEYYDIDLRSEVNDFTENRAEKLRRGFAKAGYCCMRMTDSAVASVAWYGKYLQTLNRLLAEGVPQAEMEAQAVAQADDFVARTQGAARTLDLTPIQLTTIGRLISPFITSQGAQYNTMIETIGAARSHQLSPSEALWAVAANAIAPALFSGGVAAFMAGAVAAFSGDDDAQDRVLKAILKEILANPFGGLPVGRDVANVVASKLADKIVGGKQSYQPKVFDAGAIGAAEKIARSIISGGDAAFDGNWARAAWQWADAIGSATHTPAISIYTKAKKAYENNGGVPPEFLRDLDEAIKAKKQKGK